MLRRSAFLTALVASIGILSGTMLSACAEKEPPPVSGGEVAVAPEPIPVAEEWDEIEVLSGYAKTQISVTGHFVISRNACFVEENGAVNLEVWSRLARSVNAAGKLTALAEPRCFAGSSSPRALDGNVEVKFKSGKRMVLEARGQEVCTWIPDEAVAKDLLGAINSTLVTAFSENCSL